MEGDGLPHGCYLKRQGQLSSRQETATARHDAFAGREIRDETTRTCRRCQASISSGNSSFSSSGASP